MQKNGWLRKGQQALFVLTAALLLGALQPAARAQENAPVAGGRMVRGTVTAATADHLTVKTERGEEFQVAVTPNTRITKDRQPIQPADVKPGDSIGAMGVLDAPNHTVHAAFVMVVDAAQVAKMRAEMGKSYIAGRVAAIDDLKLTIQRPDGVSQTIAVDEGTSFRKGRRRGMGAMTEDAGSMPGSAPTASDPNAESITLADIKLGDMVGGRGALKNGIFVPSELTVMDASQRRQRRNGGDAGSPNGTDARPQP